MAEYAKLIRKTAHINERIKTQPERVSRALGETAQEAAAVAKQIVPVRTGYLRSSIFVQQEGAFRFVVGASPPYARYVEEGTIHQEAQPFIRPAVALARRHLLDRFKR